MRTTKLISAAAVVATLFASPAMASWSCNDNFYRVTKDDAPVHREKIVSSGGSLNGTAYTKATFCPVAAAAGTCTGESLSERVGSTLIKYITFDGNVPDVQQYQYGKWEWDYNWRTKTWEKEWNGYGPKKDGSCD